MKRRRLFLLLSVPVLVLALGLVLPAWVLHTQSGAKWLLSRVASNLEGRLSIGEISGSLSNGLLVRDLYFKEEGLELVVTRLRVVAGLSVLPFQVRVRSLQAEGLKIGLPGADQIVLPVANAQGQVALRAPYEQTWNGHGSVLEPLATVGFEFAFKGVPEKYDLSLQATLDNHEFPLLELRMSGQGDLDGLRVDSLASESGFLNFTATGAVSWVGSASVDLDVDVQRFEPAHWIPAWPGEQFVYGHLALYMDDSTVDVQRFSARVAGLDLELEGAGQLDLQAELLSAKLSWQEMTWAAGAGAYGVASDSGQLQLSGSPDDWRFTSDLELDTVEYPGGRFELEGNGNISSAEINIGKGNVLGGIVTGQAQLDWSSELYWNAQLEVKQIDTSALMPAWPARLDATFGISQNLADDSLEIQFENLHGELDGRNLHGSGGITVKKSMLSFNALRLYAGNSKVLLDGSPDDLSGLEFSLDINRPGWMADYIGAEVSGRGRIALQASLPVVDIEVKAKDIAWGDTRIESLMVTPGAGSKPGVDLSVSAKNLEFGDLTVPTADAIITGDRRGQALQLRLGFGGHELVSKLNGSVGDWSSLANVFWSGQISGLTLTSDQQTVLSLQNPVPLNFSADGFSLGEACFEVESSSGLCLESSWQANGRFDLVASLSELPLSLSQLIYPHHVEFTQTLDGEFRWTRLPGENPSGSAAITISAGQFGDDQNEYGPISTAEGFFGFQLTGGSLTAGEFDIPFPDIGEVDLDFAISDMALDGTGKVDGKARIDLNDISVLEQLLPGLEQTGGQLNTDLQVSGTVFDPVLTGLVSLQNGSADIHLLGTQLRQVRLEGSVNNTDRVVLEGEFMAGDGHGQIALEVEFADWSTPGMQMILSGESLRLLDTAELRMNANTDIRVAWKRGEWTINGEVEVQKTRIAPVATMVSKVEESEDVQLVAGTLPYSRTEHVTEPVRLTGNLNISLGDNVKIDTELAKAKLSGAVRLSWDGETIPIASGSIHADGTLSVFGPKLHVKDGQLRFSGGPVNNPTLEIRAEREVFGNTQIRTAGVSITGPAGRPVIEAYTRPLTTTDRAWALLITGSDVDYGQGIGAFEVGTYIAPRLYLSYGISLFDDDNVVSARYDLKKGFGVKASSGQRESGIDMSYTIDR